MEITLNRKGDVWDILAQLYFPAFISTRLNRVIQGNFGNCRSVGGDVRELKVDYGPGYRVYFAEDGKVLVILLCGGDKRSQWKDIENAKKYWREYCETKTS